MLLLGLDLTDIGIYRNTQLQNCRIGNLDALICEAFPVSHFLLSCKVLAISGRWEDLDLYLCWSAYNLPQKEAAGTFQASAAASSEPWNCCQRACHLSLTHMLCKRTQELGWKQQARSKHCLSPNRTARHLYEQYSIHSTNILSNHLAHYHGKFSINTIQAFAWNLKQLAKGCSWALL